jgi:hypothetical protein
MIVAFLCDGFEGLLVEVGAAVFIEIGFFAFDTLIGAIVCSIGLAGDDGETGIDML